MRQRLAKLQTLARLGAGSILRVAAYRAGLRLGIHPVQRLSGSSVHGPFFRKAAARTDLPPANRLWKHSLEWFGWHRVPTDGVPPDWYQNPFGEGHKATAKLPWYRIPDFGNGDIKGVWELSRMNWIVALATCAAHGDASALDRMNNWIADWSTCNPPYLGSNWKCGQEASIRVIHLIAAAWVLGQEATPEESLAELVALHLQRIEPTLSYAVGQQNNHGTSEAAALYVGGTFLRGRHKSAARWADKGRRLLKERALALIEKDGSFSQYSVNYHRLMLDTYSFCEAWRRHTKDKPFAAEQLQRLSAATLWLASMVDPLSGDAANIGANDGAKLLPLIDADYRDFRASVQLAAALFRDQHVYGDGPWNDLLRWLCVPLGRTLFVPTSTTFAEGGYHVLLAGRTKAILRFPRFRFRPGQADALHLDVWRDGKNILRDAGTFSYNASGAEWYSGTSAHNTVAFDDQDQMPRLGRFLFGDWLQSGEIEPVSEAKGACSASASYKDRKGRSHVRRVTLSGDSLICTDDVSGAFLVAILRLRLSPGDWTLKGHTLEGVGTTISVNGDAGEIDVSLEETEESRYYLQSSKIPVLVVKATGPGRIVTRIDL